MSFVRNLIPSITASARTASRHVNHNRHSRTLYMRLTFVDRMYAVIAVILCGERESEYVFCQIPVISGV